MYDLPSRNDIAKCIITDETVRDSKAPTLIDKDGGEIEEPRESA
jgi:ATP-dependent Clp protease ATP-binding subunit ClpX